MQDFIRMAAQQLGTSEDSARSTTAGLMDLIKENASAGDFQELLGKVPGAEGLIGQAAGAAAGTGGGGGMLGGLAGKASSMLGGNLGAGLGALAVLKNAGLDSGNAGSLVSLFAGYLKDKAGAALVTKVLGNVPGLLQLVK